MTLLFTERNKKFTLGNKLSGIITETEYSGTIFALYAEIDTDKGSKKEYFLKLPPACYKGDVLPSLKGSIFKLYNMIHPVKITQDMVDSGVTDKENLNKWVDSIDMSQGDKNTKFREDLQDGELFDLIRENWYPKVMEDSSFLGIANNSLVDQEEIKWWFTAFRITCYLSGWTAGGTSGEFVALDGKVKEAEPTDDDIKKILEFVPAARNILICKAINWYRENHNMGQGECSKFMTKVFVLHEIVRAGTMIKGPLYTLLYNMIHFADNRNILYSFFYGNELVRPNLVAGHNIGMYAPEEFKLDNFFRLRTTMLPSGAAHLAFIRGALFILTMSKHLQTLPNIVLIPTALNEIKEALTNPYAIHPGKNYLLAGTSHNKVSHTKDETALLPLIYDLICYITVFYPTHTLCDSSVYSKHKAMAHGTDYMTLCKEMKAMQTSTMNLHLISKLFKLGGVTGNDEHVELLKKLDMKNTVDKESVSKWIVNQNKKVLAGLQLGSSNFAFDTAPKLTKGLTDDEMKKEQEAFEEKGSKQDDDKKGDVSKANVVTCASMSKKLKGLVAQTKKNVKTKMDKGHQAMVDSLEKGTIDAAAKCKDKINIGKSEYTMDNLDLNDVDLKILKIDGKSMDNTVANVLAHLASDIDADM